MEVYGPQGNGRHTVTYLDVNAQPQRADAVTLPWTYDTTTTQPPVFVNLQAQGDGDSIGCRITIDDAVGTERSTPCTPSPPLSGQIRMSAGRVPDFIRRYSVLIAFFWLGLAVVTNVFVPQLETVAESHGVSLSPTDARRRCGRPNRSAGVPEFDSGLRP